MVLVSMGFPLMKNEAELAEVVSTKIPFAVACKAMFESRMALSWGCHGLIYLCQQGVDH